MSLLGKILLFVNVLMAVGFLYVAGLNWGKRQSWANAVLQHQLVIDGVPIDDQDKDKEGGPRSKDLTDQEYQQLFQKAGGDVSKTQVDEVQKVKGKVQQWIDDANVKGTKAQKLAFVLMQLSPSIDDYEILKKRWEDPAANDPAEDVLQARLDQAFEDAKSPKMTIKNADGSTQEKDRSPAQRRQAICHLLFAMSRVLAQTETPPQPLTASKAYQRIVSVCGLDTCIGEVNDQADLTQRLTEDVRHGMALDRERFLAADRALLAQVEDLSEKVERQKSFLKVQNDLLDNQKKLVDIRRLEVDRMEKELAAAREKTKEELKVQARMEDQLFKSRRANRDAFEKNLQYEQQLRSLEKGR
jgi:hypothetical protein